jgi:molybdate/tungstate transport system permease protein
MKKKPDPFLMLTVSCGIVVLFFILIPLIEMLFQPSIQNLIDTIQDKDVRNSLWLSIYTSCFAAVISFIIGTPFAYMLARREFPGKKFIESIIDIPIMIPHPVIGIALLSLAGRGHWLGDIFRTLGVRIMGSITGIITVMIFVGLPFYINTVKAGFELIPERLEKVSRSLGASTLSTFCRITFPLAWRAMVVGMIMCIARAISEFGAIVIVAYHPMIAPVLIYERFTAYGLKYSQPVAVWLIFVCLAIFLLLRFFSTPRPNKL